MRAPHPNEPPTDHAAPRRPMRRVGVAWSSTKGHPSIIRGEVVVGGLRQPFVVKANRDRTKNSAVEYVLLSAFDPEPVKVRDPETDAEVP